jgi:hypothetical protein
VTSLDELLPARPARVAVFAGDDELGIVKRGGTKSTGAPGARDMVVEARVVLAEPRDGGRIARADIVQQRFGLLAVELEGGTRGNGPGIVDLGRSGGPRSA